MLVVEEHVEDDKLLPADMRTMEEIRKMSNSICTMIQLEEDYPSKHDNKQLAILDLNVEVKLVTVAKKWRLIEARGAETRGWRYKVVELGGRQMRSIVCRNPWAGPCSSANCMVCTTGGKGNCRRPGCTYEVQCLA